MNDLDLELVPAPASPQASVLAARYRRALVAAIAGGREARAGRRERVGEGRVGMPARARDGAAARDVGTGAAAGHACAGASASACARPGPGRDEADGAKQDVESACECECECECEGEGEGEGEGVSLATAFDVVGSVAASAETARRLASAVPSVRGAVDPAAPATSAKARTTMPDRLPLDGALVVPAGTLVRGYLRCRALLLAGDIVGNVHCTAGPVVIRSGATLTGRLVASGDVYVCGTVSDGGGGAIVSTRGKLTLAPGARVDGDVRSGRLDLHDGSMLLGVARRCED